VESIRKTRKEKTIFIEEDKIDNLISNLKITDDDIQIKSVPKMSLFNCLKDQNILMNDVIEKMLMLEFFDEDLKRIERIINYDGDDNYHRKVDVEEWVINWINLIIG
jgi:hypothetical protein